MKKVILRPNFQLLLDSKGFYFDLNSTKILHVLDKQAIVYDSLDDFFNEFSKIYESVHKKTKA